MKRPLVMAAFALLTVVSATESGFAQPVPYPDPYAPHYGHRPAIVYPRNILGEPSEPEATPDEVFLEAYRSRYCVLSLSHPNAATIDVAERDRTWNVRGKQPAGYHLKLYWR
jgi:hypothetical protein